MLSTQSVLVVDHVVVKSKCSDKESFKSLKVSSFKTSYNLPVDENVYFLKMRPVVTADVNRCL